MKEEHWTRWIMQTARSWEDLSPIIKSTGLDMVDHDHQQLMEYALELNYLIDNLQNDKFNLVYLDEQHSLLDNLYQFTQQHFSREQELMKHYRITNLDYHLQQHKEILSMLKGYLDEFDAGKITVTRDLKLSIMEWVVVHINEVDNNTFSLKNWKHILIEAKSWDDLKAIIKRTDIKLIDNEHRQLVESSLKLNSVISAKQGTNQVQQARTILEELQTVVHKHFHDEEEFIKHYKLPNLSQQQEQHTLFHDMLNKNINQPDNQLINNLASLKVSIIEWWIQHINKLDFNTLSLALLGQTLIKHAESSEDLYCIIKRTGIAQVDKEHLQLIEIAMEMAAYFDSPLLDNTFDQVNELFVRLITCAADHFKHEESIMNLKASPLLDTHHSEHQRLLDELKVIHQQFKKGLITFSHHLKIKIINWWINHTNKIDIETFGEANHD